MAQEVGADLWHMNCVSGRLVAKFPDSHVAFSIDYGGRSWGRRQLLGTEEKAVAGFIIVDRYGRRYTNENIKSYCVFYELTQFDTHRLEYSRVPSYYIFIFDRKRMGYGSLMGVSELEEKARERAQTILSRLGRNVGPQPVDG